jgi:hypothetical protein
MADIDSNCADPNPRILEHLQIGWPILDGVGWGWGGTSFRALRMAKLFANSPFFELAEN